MTPVEVFRKGQRHPLGLSLGALDLPPSNDGRVSLDRSRNIDNTKQEQKTEKREDKGSRALIKRRKVSYAEEGSKLSLEIVSSESDMTVEEEEEEEEKEEESTREIRSSNHRLEEDLECSLTLSRLKGVATANVDYSVSKDFLMVLHDNHPPSDHNRNPLMGGESDDWLQLGLSSSSLAVHVAEEGNGDFSSFGCRDEGEQNKSQSTTLQLLSRNSDTSYSRSWRAFVPVADRQQARFKRPAVLPLLDNHGLELAAASSWSDQPSELPLHDWQAGIVRSFGTNLQFQDAMLPQPDEGFSVTSPRSRFQHGVEEFPLATFTPSGFSTIRPSQQQSWSNDGNQSLPPVPQYRHWNMAPPGFLGPPLFASLLDDNSSNRSSSFNAFQATTKPSSSFLPSTPSQQPLLFAEERSRTLELPSPSAPLNPQHSNNSSTSSLCERLRVVKGSRGQTGIWFALEPAADLDKEGCILPQIQKNYLHVKDGKVKVSVVKKYIAAKLGLDGDSEEVEMRCRGQVINEKAGMSLHHIRDNLWFSPHLLQTEPAATSSGKHHIMVLTYNRSKRPPHSSSSSTTFTSLPTKCNN